LTVQKLRVLDTGNDIPTKSADLTFTAVIILCNAQDDFLIESLSADKLVNFLLWEYLSRVNCQLWLLHMEWLEGGNPARNVLNLHYRILSFDLDVHSQGGHIKHISHWVPYSSAQCFKCKSYDIRKGCSSLGLISASGI